MTLFFIALSWPVVRTSQNSSSSESSTSLLRLKPPCAKSDVQSEVVFVVFDFVCSDFGFVKFCNFYLLTIFMFSQRFLRLNQYELLIVHPMILSYRLIEHMLVICATTVPPFTLIVYHAKLTNFRMNSRFTFAIERIVSSS